MISFHIDDEKLLQKYKAIWTKIENLKKVCLRQFSFLLFCFALYKMVDSEHSTNICNSIIINIGAVMRNPEMLKSVPDRLKTKKMRKHAVKKLPYLIRYIPDQYKTQEMCNKVILEYGRTLKSVPDRYKK